MGNGYLLAMVFPAELVSRFHGPNEWRQQALETIKHYDRSIVPAFFGGMGPCQLLRMGEVDAAFEGARWPKDWPTNGFTIARADAVFQADHAPGMCRTLADMLVLGLDGTIHLFAGIPEKEPARFLSLRHQGVF